MKVRINRFNRRKKESIVFFSPGVNNPLFTFLSTEKKLTLIKRAWRVTTHRYLLKGPSGLNLFKTTELSCFFCFCFFFFFVVFFSVIGLKYRIE